MARGGVGNTRTIDNMRAGFGKGQAGSEQVGASGGAGARHIPHYVDLHEDYVPVSRPLLKELSTFGWLQEGAGAAGMFFFSGAFWLLATMLYEHGFHLSEYLPWALTCILSMLFGGVLMWISYWHFKLKQNRIEDIFREHPSSSPG